MSSGLYMVGVDTPYKADTFAKKRATHQRYRDVKKRTATLAMIITTSA